jgi:hypothetical protein
MTTKDEGTGKASVKARVGKTVSSIDDGTLKLTPAEKGGSQTYLGVCR